MVSSRKSTKKTEKTSPKSGKYSIKFNQQQKENKKNPKQLWTSFLKLKIPPSKSTTPINRSDIYKFIQTHRIKSKSLSEKSLKIKKLNSINPINEPNRLTSIGLLIWSQKFTDLSGLKMIDNYLVRYDPQPDLIQPDSGERIEMTDFCDFIFPILIGFPGNIPLDDDWIKKIKTIMKPGCYLACARPKTSHHWNVTEQNIKVDIWNTNLQTYLPRLDANLLFIMQSACSNDVNLNVTEYVNFIDDMDSVNGHFFPHRVSQNMFSILYPKRFVPRGGYQPLRPKTHLQKLVDKITREPSEESLNTSLIEDSDEVKRSLKRHSDLVEIYSKHLMPDIYKLRETFVTEKPKDDRNFYSERFNFFLSQDSFAVILDQNCAFDRLQQKIVRDLDEKQHHPFVRLIRSGAYVAIEGSPRYANLTDEAQTFFERSMFRCRLTCFPMLILQEGVKAFDAYYSNDGLDFTYFDCIKFDELIIIDWYQIQIDLKMDQQQRSFKGQIMHWDEMNDILPNSPISSMINQSESLGKFKETELIMERDKTDNQRLGPLVVFTLQQVLFTYFSALKSRLEIVWNCFIRIDENHIHSSKLMTNCTNPAYFFMKSFNFIYLWTQKNRDSPLEESKSSEIILNNLNVSDMDLAKVGWSHRNYAEYFKIYLNRLNPYQETIKNWLIDETRRVKHQLMIRPTTLTDKLLYRNGFYLMKIEQFHRDQWKKPRKSFLNIKRSPILKSKSKQGGGSGGTSPSSSKQQQRPKSKNKK